MREVASNPLILAQAKNAVKISVMNARMFPRPVSMRSLEMQTPAETHTNAKKERT